MKRRKAYAPRDKRIFRQTADRTKAMNINPRIMRGGVRL